jgi:hypothetical protein
MMEMELGLRNVGLYKYFDAAVCPRKICRTVSDFVVSGLLSKICTLPSPVM